MIEAIAGRLVSKEIESLFADMEKAWDYPRNSGGVASSFSFSVSGRTHVER